jgi:ATPase subunit of ABC transporter with duplicated ATPase domains
MRLRLAFALATYIQPSIFLIDEMISVGDKSFAKKSENRLEEIIEKSKILIIASHNKDILNKYCNKIVEFENGQIKIL